VDLSTLTKLSRQQLDSYARRVGVEHPEQRSTPELIATLLNRGAADAERTLRNVKGSRAAQVASGVLSVIQQSGLLQRFARPEALPKTASVPPHAPARSQAPTPATPIAPIEAAAIPKAAPAVEPTPAVAAPIEATVSAPPQAASAESEPAPQALRDDGVPTRRFIEEPIRTRSMARVLAIQGHRERAISILESIVREQPNDLAARDDLERLRADIPLDATALPEPRTLPTLPDTGDRIELRTLPGRELHITWSTTEAGQARAKTVLGSDGELTLRVVAITPDPTRVVRSEITERGPVDHVQEWIAPAVEAGSRCFAAIGMRSGGRFVAIAHAPARTID
jgi:hypothetical protein